MPEFAEVNVHVQYLRPRCEGFAIAEITHHGRQHFKGIDPSEVAPFFVGNHLTAVTQRGKHVLMHTPRGLVSAHLMFKGRWSLVGDPFTSRYHHHADPPTDQSRTITLTGPAGRLGFHSPEFKANVQIHPGVHDAAAVEGLSALGPDVILTPESDPAFTEGWSAAALTASAARSKQAIKVFLLDQKRQAGLGNMYVCEALYRAGVSPHTPAREVSAEALARVYEAAVEIVQAAIAGGLDYGALLRVYKRAADPQGHAVRCEEVGGRDTYWVPEVQR